MKQKFHGTDLFQTILANTGENGKVHHLFIVSTIVAYFSRADTKSATSMPSRIQGLCAVVYAVVQQESGKAQRLMAAK